MTGYTILAPAAVDGVLDFRPIDAPEQIVLSDELPYKSPKEAVLPRVEALLRFSGDQVTEEKPGKPILLIGVKPCDITALKILDAIFLGPKSRFVDPFYKKRRDLLTVFGMGCIEKKRGCFCEERGIDMDSPVGCDVCMELTENSMMLKFDDPALSVLMQAFTGVRSEVDGSLDDALFKSPRESAHGTKLLEIKADETEVFDKMPWEQYVEGCLGCGTCTFLCPTCHCFEFRDSESDGAVSRYRCWDSCMYPKFTLHASGHNPRSSKKERFRQRVMHKYIYIPENFGYTACTGCGRCIRSCPGGVNIRKTVSDISARLSAQRAGTYPDEKGSAV